MQIKQAMILAAGHGTRLRPLTLETPKPLLCIAGRPILSYILETLSGAGIEKIVVNTHHLASQIENYLKAYPSVIISHEDTLLETGGGIVKAMPYFESHPFFVINGDTYWSGSLERALHRLRQSWDQENMDALLLLVPQPRDKQGSGDYFLTSSGLLRYRDEHEQAPYMYSGLSILHPGLLASAKPGVFSLVPYFHKAQSHDKLYGLVHEGFWEDIGTLDSFQHLQRQFGA